MEIDVYCIGMGAVTAVSKDIGEFRKALKQGNSGIDPVKGFDCTKFKAKYGGEISELPSCGKFFAMAEKAMLEALEDADIGLEELNGNTRAGFIFGTSLGDTIAHEKALSDVYKNSERPANIQQRVKPNVLAYTASKLREKLHIKGSSITISNTCVTGISAIAVASSLILAGILDICIVGCADILGQFIYSGMDSMKALSKKAVLEPFSSERDGIILGEGSGFIILANESCKAAKKKFYAKVAGHAITNDAVHLSSSDRNANGLTEAIIQSLKMSELKAEEIDCIFCCGNGTKYNDAMQAKAIDRVWPFTDSQVPVTSIKPVIGHTLAASGIIESIGIMIMMDEGYIAPIGRNYEHDPEINPIKLLHSVKEAAVSKAILLSSGFSGVNGSVVLRKV